MTQAAPRDIEEILRAMLVSTLGIDPGVVAASTIDTPLIGHGIGLDSIETLALVCEIENVFGIRVEESDLTVDLLQNLRTLSAYVERRLDRHADATSGEPGE